jgi:hypothetical protein
MDEVKARRSVLIDALHYHKQLQRLAWSNALDAFKKQVRFQLGLCDLPEEECEKEGRKRMAAWKEAQDEIANLEVTICKLREYIHSNAYIPPDTLRRSDTPQDDAARPDSSS